MKICFLLHFYQPYKQQFDILDRVVNECYRPLLTGLSKNRKAKIVVNINGVLTQQLMNNGYTDVIDLLRKLAENGQVEFTASSMYHAFLPLIPEKEIIRQIELNNKINSEVFGKYYNPIGFFSPEMGVNDKVLRVISELGYKWVAVPQIAKIGEDKEIAQGFYRDKKSRLNVFFRNKRVSSLVLSAVVRDATTLINETADLLRKDKYWFCVMDAETFGHHRISHEKVLFDILNHPNFKPVLTSELLKDNLKESEVSIRPSTWTNEEQDYWLEGKYVEENSFVLWKDPENPIHVFQWKLLDYVLSKNPSGKSRKILDYAISSDQFWWASAKPWWSLEMIELGAYNLKSVVNTPRAESLYRQIMDKAFEWQRTGYIRKMHLDNSSTYMNEPFKKRAPREWYNQIILEFEGEMNKAAGKQDYERAIKWRDAVYKLKQGTDIYDVLHVVDELWSVRKIPEIKPFLEHDPSEFSDFAKKHFN